MISGILKKLFKRGHVEFEISCLSFVSDYVIQLKTYRNGEYALSLHKDYSGSPIHIFPPSGKKRDIQISKTVYNKLKPIFMKAKGVPMDVVAFYQNWLDFSKEIEQVLLDSGVEVDSVRPETGGT